MNVITITDVGFLTDFDQDLGILFGPYLTDDPAKLFKLYDRCVFAGGQQSAVGQGSE